MSRERIVRFALRSYPQEIRASKGTEMLGTLLDSSGQSNAAFARELVDLARRGLSARATSTAQVGARRLIADGLCWGGIALIAELLCVRVANYITFGQSSAEPGGWVWEIALLAAGLVLALVGYDRIAGICALSFLAVVIGASRQAFDGGSLLLPDLIVGVVCFAPMLIAPRRRTHDMRQLAWLFAIAALGAAFYWPRPIDGLVALYILPLSVALPFALALLPTDPRLAIAWSLVAAFVGMGALAQAVQQGRLTLALPLTVIALTAAPFALAITVTRTRSLTRRDSA